MHDAGSGWIRSFFGFILITRQKSESGKPTYSCGGHELSAPATLGGLLGSFGYQPAGLNERAGFHRTFDNFAKSHKFLSSCCLSSEPTIEVERCKEKERESPM